MTKYCCVDFSGTVDGKSELDPEDDAAYVNWGEDWRMPTYEQVMELLNNCTWTMTTVNGVSGRLVTGPNGNTMFMPIPGFRIHEELKDPSWAYYWTREIYQYNSDSAYNLIFHSQAVFRGTSNRFVGNPVRAVRVSNE